MQTYPIVIKEAWKPVLLIVAVYLILAGWNSSTRKPGIDEVQFANPAIDLITRGMTGVTMTSGWGAWPELPRVDAHTNRYTYWAMPLSFMGLAGWFKVVGFGFFRMRAWPVLFGLIGLLAWYCIVFTITGIRSAALLAMALVTVDRAYLDAASEARPDMQCAALGFAAIAAYLILRGSDRGLNKAVLISQGLLALSIFTHPLGGLSFISVFLMAICFDHARLRWHHLLIASVPYVIAASAWGWYISLDPYAFRTQFFFNANPRVRLGGVQSPFGSVVREVQMRFVSGMYMPSYVTGFRRMTLAIPVVYWIAAICPFLSATFRQKRRAWLMLPLLAIIDQILFVLGEGTKSVYYLVHITPLFAACCALLVTHWLQVRRRVGVALAATAAMLGCMQLFWLAGSCLQDRYHRSYRRVVAFVQKNASPNELINAQGQFAYAFGFYNPNFTEDPMLGYYTQRRPAWIIVDDKAYAQAFIGMREKAPAIATYVDTLMARNFEKVFSVPNYDVYHVRPSGVPGGGPAGER